MPQQPEPSVSLPVPVRSGPSLVAVWCTCLLILLSLTMIIPRLAAAHPVRLTNASTVANAPTTGFNSAPLKQRAKVLLESGNLLECVSVWHTIRTFAATVPDRIEAQVRMGDVYGLFLDMPQQALAAYDAALRLSGMADDHTMTRAGSSILENAWFNSGMLLYEQGRYADTARYFQGYVTRYPAGIRLETARYMLERSRAEAAGTGSVPRPDSGKSTARLGGVPKVRVLLARGTDIVFSLSQPVRLSDGTMLDAGRHIVTARGTNVVRDAATPVRYLEFTVPRGTTLAMGATRYAGDFRLVAHEDEVLLVNTLDMETYLQGVVSREMSPSFSESALRAQAVAARTYARYMQTRSYDAPYDVTATTASQVYGGIDAATARTNAAVSATRGRVLHYGNRLVLPYFHAHSGGMLEDDKQVWMADLPYYTVRDDAVSNAARDMHWQTAFDFGTVARRLREAGFAVSRVQGVRAGEYSSSGRLVTVLVHTGSSELAIRSNTLRLLLGPTQMKSTLCSVTEKDGRVLFSGIEYGHGVGMSQWGAEGMGRSGATDVAILRHYYPGTTVETLY